MIRIFLSLLKQSYFHLVLKIKAIFGIKRSRVSIGSNLVMDIRHNDVFGKSLLYGRVPEPALISYLQRLIKPGMTVLDIGANIGYVTLLCSSAVGHSGKVISFEPSPNILQELKDNLALNNVHNCFVEPIALSDNNDRVDLVLPQNGMESHSSFRPNATFSSVGAISVVTEKLDSVVRRLALNRIDVIKIDVEGAELLVLKGAEDVLSKIRPVVLFESAENLTEAFGYSVFDVLSFVRSHKYQLRQISHGNWLAIPE